MGRSGASAPLLHCVWLLFASVRAEAPEKKPHIVVMLADNVGWAAVKWHQPPALSAEEITPKLDALRASGVELDRHYTYKFCSPSRCSFLSGRLPAHANIYNDDPAMPGAGAPVQFRLMPMMLRAAGYRTHFAGKWHVGMASASTQPPLARGFDTSLGYFHSTNNYYDQRRAEGCGDAAYVDLWDGDGPSALNGSAYEELVFRDRVVDVVRAHDASAPLFVYYALHTSCVGFDPEGTAGGERDSLQPEATYYARFAAIDDHDRRANVAMVALMDDVAGDVVAALEDQALWDSTLFLWSSDNGGAVHLGGGSNTWPLRGGYYNNFEGGVRAPAFLAGGALPPAARGRKLTEWIYIADWYATFARLAGVAADDGAVPAVDSLDVWDAIAGNATSPRVEWVQTPLQENATRAMHGGDACLFSKPYKLLVGAVRQNGWPGQVHPNTTVAWDSFADVLDCAAGCLFDVGADPEERHDLAAAMPDKVAELRAKLEGAAFYDPDRGEPDPRACAAANRTGYWAPFLP